MTQLKKNPNFIKQAGSSEEDFFDLKQDIPLDDMAAFYFENGMRIDIIETAQFLYITNNCSGKWAIARKSKHPEIHADGIFFEDPSDKMLIEAYLVGLHNEKYQNNVGGVESSG